MALTGKIEYKGITLTSAYVQIVRVTGGPKDGGYNCVLRVYATLAARLANSQDYLFEKQMNWPSTFVSGADPFASCFNHLSADGGEFAGFANC